MPEEDSARGGPEFLPEIRRARFARLTIYEISEAELTVLERGAPSSRYLNFSIFLLSTALSFTVALLTTTVGSDRTFVIFVVVAALGYLLGAFFLLLWYRSYRAIREIASAIRRRLPPEGEAEPLP